MSKIRAKLQQFMYGRYGADELYAFTNIFVLISAIAEAILGMFIVSKTWGFVVLIFWNILNVALIIWSMVRFFSKNIFKRKFQNRKFLSMKKGVKRFFTFNTSKRSQNGPQDGNGYIYRDCTYCGSTLRLPHKAGRNAVVCPRCSRRFFVKAKKIK